MSKRIILLLGSVFLTCVGFGCNTSCASQLYPADSDCPIDIESHSATLDNNQGVVTYSGNVRMKQGSRHLQSDTLILRKNTTGQLESMTAIGNPAQLDLQPNAQKPPIHAEATMIEYFPKEKTIVLRKNALLSQASHTVLGEHLVYFLETQALSAQRSDKRTTLRFGPKTQTP